MRSGVFPVTRLYSYEREGVALGLIRLPLVLWSMAGNH